MASAILFLSRTDIASGRDKYFYLAQLQSFVGSLTTPYDSNSYLWIAESIPFVVVTSTENAVRAVATLNVFAIAVLLAIACYRIQESVTVSLFAVGLFFSGNLLVPLSTEFIAELSGISSILIVLLWPTLADRWWSLLPLALTAAVAHRSAAACLAILIGARFLRLRFPNLPAASIAFAVLLLMLTWAADVLTLGTRPGPPLGPLGSWLVSSSHREGVAIALALYVWRPSTDFACVAKRSLVWLAAFIFWNPFLETDSGFNTVGSRLGLMAAWLLPLVTAIGVSSLWKRSRMTGVVVLVALVVVNSWPQDIRTISTRWAERRSTLDAALSQAGSEFHHGGSQVAEHGIQFVVNLRTGESASAHVEAERMSDAWWWVALPDAGVRFSRGYWITDGWIQVPTEALIEWMKAAPPADVAAFSRLNPHTGDLKGPPLPAGAIAPAVGR